MKKAVLFLFLLAALQASGQSKDELAIRKLLNSQAIAWNQGDIESFMKGYWESDSLIFIGKSGITYGWNNTLSNYKKNYPDTAAMGKLAFTLLIIKKLSLEYYQVIGKWHLQRSIGNLEGHFTLLFRKINGNWVIISDHSS
jgi:ketosteroid isomerase-like protein